MDENHTVAAMLRNDVEQFRRVVSGVTPALPLPQVAPEIIRHLTIAADALEGR